jgi:hypothetical protein
MSGVAVAEVRPISITWKSKRHGEKLPHGTILKAGKIMVHHLRPKSECFNGRRNGRRELTADFFKKIVNSEVAVRCKHCWTDGSWKHALNAKVKKKKKELRPAELVPVNLDATGLDRWFDL